MIESKLYIIVYQMQDTEVDWIHTISVDMDNETAQLLVLNKARQDYDNQDLTYDELAVVDMWYEQVMLPDWHIELIEKSTA